jgi:hypothetical protein
MSLPRRLLGASGLLAVLTLLACTTRIVDDTTAPTNVVTAHTVRIINDGTVAFTGLRVQTSDKDILPLIATLNPGQSSTAYAVATMHSYPFIVATARGREVSAHPVEGFSGFNSLLAPGAHLLRVRLADDGVTLDVRVLDDK